MFLCKTEILKSMIEGHGVFTLEDISEGSTVWQFDPKHDKSMSQEDFEELSEDKRREIEKVGYLSPTSGMWIYSLEGSDHFTNHSSSRNNLTTVFDATISPEPFFRANRAISKNEELIVNYLEFDEFIKNTKPDWTQ